MGFKQGTWWLHQETWSQNWEPVRHGLSSQAPREGRRGIASFHGVPTDLQRLVIVEIPILDKDMFFVNLEVLKFGESASIYCLVFPSLSHTRLEWPTSMGLPPLMVPLRVYRDIPKTSGKKVWTTKHAYDLRAGAVLCCRLSSLKTASTEPSLCLSTCAG